MVSFKRIVKKFTHTHTPHCPPNPTPPSPSPTPTPPPPPHPTRGTWQEDVFLPGWRSWVDKSSLQVERQSDCAGGSRHYGEPSGRAGSLRGILLEGVNLSVCVILWDARCRSYNHVLTYSELIDVGYDDMSSVASSRPWLMTGEWLYCRHFILDTKLWVLTGSCPWVLC